MINRKGPYVLMNGHGDEAHNHPLGMTFCDYQFWMNPNGDIVFDPELVEDTVDRKFKVGSSYVLTRTKKGNLAMVRLDKPYSIVPYPPMDTDVEWPRR